MDKILTFSDLHIDGRDPVARDRFAAALAHGLARHGDAAAIVLCGDLTANGKPADYATLRDLLDRVALPVLPMLGNHDKRKSFRAAFPDAAVSAQGHVQQVFDVHRHRLITLDTLDPGQIDGHLCPDRIAWLMAQLDAAGDRHKIIFTHHPPMKLGDSSFDDVRLRDGPDVLELLASSDNCTVIAGHVHRPAAGVSRGVPWITLPSTHRAFGLAPSDPEPGDLPGYGVLMLQKHGLAWHPILLPNG